MPEFWDLSCRDWRDRIRNGRSLIPRLPLNKALSNRAVTIFNKLHLPDVEGQPLLKDAAGDWFKEYVSTLFGSMIGDERMIREGFLLIPKKSSKTSYGAALMLTALLLNRRPRAELLFIGPTKAVADLAYAQASGMIQADDYLKTQFHIQDHLKRITLLKTEAILQIKSFDMAVLTGIKPAAVLIDELHEISAASAATRIVGQIRGGLLPNSEAHLTFITTQSDVVPAGVFKAELSRARAIRDGQVQGRMLPMLYEFPEDISHPVEEADVDPPWFNSKTWYMVNPNLGRPVTIDRLEEDFETAKQAGDAEIRRWASQHLNIEIGLAWHSDRWIGALYWEQCRDEDLNLDFVINNSEVLVIGIDGGGLEDLLSVCILGRESQSKRWLCWTKSWAHSKILDRIKSESERLLDFEREGDLTLVEDLGQDIEEVADLCLRIYNTGKLAKIGLDPMGIGSIIDALAERHIDHFAIGIPQGFKLTGSIKTLERKLVEKMFVFGRQNINDWAVGNAKIEFKGNAILITKQISGRAKIDPLMAILDGVTLMSQNPEAQGSIYSDKRDYERIFKKHEKEEIDRGPWSPEILQDIHHPLFQEHKIRFEAWQKKQPDDDDNDLDRWIR